MWIQKFTLEKAISGNRIKDTFMENLTLCFANSSRTVAVFIQLINCLSIYLGSVLSDSTNHKLKAFGNKFMSVLNTNTVLYFSSCHHCLNNAIIIYIAIFCIRHYKQSAVDSSVWKDMHRLYANVMLCTMSELNVCGLWCTQ